MVSIAPAAPVEGLAALGENRIDGAALGKSAEIVVHGGETHAGTADAELGIEVLGAAEVGTGCQELVEGALLAGAPLPLHQVAWYHLVGNGNHCR